MKLTAEQFDEVYQRRSGADLNLLLDALTNDGSVEAPDSSPVLDREKAAQDAEREADKEAGGEGKTSWEKRQEAFEKAEAERVEAQKAAEKEAAKTAKAEKTAA